MKFPRITGEIQTVAPRHYEDLISSYTKKVAQLPGVDSIIKFGSVSTPGLSDIDLVVVMDESIEHRHDWSKLSLRQHANGHPAQSVVAHDIFIWPKRVAEAAEAFFFVDQQTVLLGQPLGGKIDNSMVGQLEQLIMLDYLIHRMEAFSHIFTCQSVSIRSLMLAISTLRHSCRFAAKNDLMATDRANQFISEINNLRNIAIESGLDGDVLKDWPEKIINFLWNVSTSLARRLKDSSNHFHLDHYPSSSKNILLGFDSANGSEIWNEIISLQLNGFLGKRSRITPIPTECINHVRDYFRTTPNINTKLSRKLQVRPKNHESIFDCPARRLRLETVFLQWEFVSKFGYQLSSGQGYIGLNNPQTGPKQFLLSKLAFANLLRIRSKLKLNQQTSRNI